MAGHEISDRAAARKILAYALESVRPGPALRRRFAYDRRNNALVIDGRRYSLDEFPEIRIVGGGKAAWLTAKEILDILGPGRISGVLNVDRGRAARPLSKKIRLFPAGHPIPNRDGVAGARRTAALLAGAGPRTLVLALISGGGSSLMAFPVPGIRLSDYQETCRLLLTVPASIDEINAVRKHIDRLKGGRMRKLAESAGAFVSLVLSDVPVTSAGRPDDPSVIASGPTVGDPTTFASAVAVLRKYGIWDRTPAAVRRYLRANLGRAANETLDPGSPLLRPERSQYVIIADNDRAMAAAAGKAAALGYTARLIGRPGSAVRKLRGEVTVEAGRIFRAVAAHVRPKDRITFAAISTDGVDGNSNLAGAVADAETWARAERRGLDPARALARFDSAVVFERLGLGIATGPTGTNVADIALVLVRGRGRKTAFIFGGETTVRIDLPEGERPGRGGRNSRLALLAARRLGGKG